MWWVSFSIIIFSVSYWGWQLWVLRRRRRQPCRTKISTFFDLPLSIWRRRRHHWKSPWSSLETYFTVSTKVQVFMYNMFQGWGLEVPCFDLSGWSNNLGLVSFWKYFRGGHVKLPKWGVGALGDPTGAPKDQKWPIQCGADKSLSLLDLITQQFLDRF